MVFIFIFGTKKHVTLSFNIQKIRADFPILQTKIYNRPLVYFDNGATTQKPNVVIDFINQFYKNQNSSIHRGVHVLSQHATEAYEEARESVRKAINAKHKYEIVFTSGATGSINLLANSFGEKYIRQAMKVDPITANHFYTLAHLFFIRKGVGLIAHEN